MEKERVKPNSLFEIQDPASGEALDFSIPGEFDLNPVFANGGGSSEFSEEELPCWLKDFKINPGDEDLRRLESHWRNPVLAIHLGKSELSPEEQEKKEREWRQMLQIMRELGVEPYANRWARRDDNLRAKLGLGPATRSLDPDEIIEDSLEFARAIKEERESKEDSTAVE